MAKILFTLGGRRAFVLVAGIAAAALSAKGHSVHSFHHVYGFLDGH